MKKQVKLLFCGLIFLVLLGSVLGFLKFFKPSGGLEKYSEGHGMSAECGGVFLNSDFKQLEAIVVNNENGSFTIKLDQNEKGEENYYLIKDDGTEVAQDLIEKSIIKNFVAEVEGMVPLKTISVENVEFEEYGLDKARTSIKLKFKDKEDIILILGNEAPLSTGYYLKSNVSDINNVYLISESSAEMFFFQVDSFIVKAKEG